MILMMNKYGLVWLLSFTLWIANALQDARRKISTEKQVKNLKKLTEFHETAGDIIV